MRALVSVLAVLALAMVLALLSVGRGAITTVKWSTKTEGATTVTWTSSFEDVDYTVGDTVQVVVTWDVLAGVAQYEDFGLKGKGFTPVSLQDPVGGDVLSIYPSGKTVTIEFRFTDLHWNDEGLVDIGNAHFKLYLMVDSNGDGLIDTLTGYGVNVHVEDPL